MRGVLTLMKSAKSASSSGASSKSSRSMSLRERGPKFGGEREESPRRSEKHGQSRTHLSESILPIGLLRESERLSLTSRRTRLPDL